MASTQQLLLSALADASTCSRLAREASIDKYRTPQFSSIHHTPEHFLSEEYIRYTLLGLFPPLWAILANHIAPFTGLSDFIRHISYIRWQGIPFRILRLLTVEHVNNVDVAASGLLPTLVSGVCCVLLAIGATC